MASVPNVTQNNFDKAEGMFWEMSYEGTDECKHGLPGDWEFGGANGEDPRTDPRWWPSTYTYLDRMLRARHATTEPRCDHEALGSYMDRVNQRVARDNKEWVICYVLVARPGEAAQPIYTNVEGATGGGQNG